jgi:hypothetical protein
MEWCTTIFAIPGIITIIKEPVLSKILHDGSHFFILLRILLLSLLAIILQLSLSYTASDREE